MGGLFQQERLPCHACPTAVPEKGLKQAYGRCKRSAGFGHGEKCRARDGRKTAQAYDSRYTECWKVVFYQPNRGEDARQGCGQAWSHARQSVVYRLKRYRDDGHPWSPVGPNLMTRMWVKTLRLPVPIKDEIMDIETLAVRFIEKVRVMYPDIFDNRYKIGDTSDMEDYQILEAIGKKTRDADKRRRNRYRKGVGHASR